MDAAVPLPLSSAAIAETHVSWIFFVGDRAYKLKKPVKTGFLDFTTRAARLAACQDELALNRRLAPDVYLGVLDIIGLDGAVCDHLVAMRRMPDERRLSRLLRDGELSDGEIDRLARAIAAFHAGATVVDADQAASIGQVWRSSLEEVGPFVGTILPADAVARARTLVDDYLRGRSPLLQQRVNQHCIRDGHGDLRADDIFLLDDGPRILDCLEFDARLRRGDILADIAFLAMDLERLGAPASAARLVAHWRELTGDVSPPSLLDHYMASRSFVRAKVACLRVAAGDRASQQHAIDHLSLALSHLERGRVVLVLVGGPPGTGKSTLAEALGREHDWTVLRSDEIRHELAAGDVAHRYGAEAKSSVYRELVDRAERALAMGEPVVLDATWSSTQHRRWAAEAAARTSTELVQLRCVVAPSIAAERVANRRERFSSEATPAVALLMDDRFDPWPAAEVVPTDRAVETTVELVRPLLPPSTIVGDRPVRLRALGAL